MVFLYIWYNKLKLANYFKYKIYTPPQPASSINNLCIKSEKNSLKTQNRNY